MDSVATVALFAAITAVFQCYKLEKRIKELEEPSKRKRQADALIAKAEIYELINKKEK